MRGYENRNLFSIATSSKPSSLPVSSQPRSKEEDADGVAGGLRRRLSSMTTSFHSASAAASSMSIFPRSKSLSSMGDYAGTSLRKWWDWSWAWILSRKPIFARDLEMNEQETKLLGSHDRGSWRHVFCRVRSEIRRFITHSDYAALPQTYRPQKVQSSSCNR